MSGQNLSRNLGLILIYCTFGFFYDFIGHPGKQPTPATTSLPSTLGMMMSLRFVLSETKLNIYEQRVHNLLHERILLKRMRLGLASQSFPCYDQANAGPWAFV